MDDRSEHQYSLSELKDYLDEGDTVSQADEVDKRVGSFSPSGGVSSGTATFSKTGPVSSRSNLTPLILVLLLVVLALLLLIVILLGVVVYKVNQPAEATMCPTVSSNTADPLTGDNDQGYDVTALINQLQKIFNDSSDMQLLYLQNTTETLSDNLELSTQIIEKTAGIVGSLSSIERINKGTEGTVNDISLLVKTIVQLTNMSQAPYIEPGSCQEIKSRQPNSPSGYYHINSKILYCEMGELCGSSEGWTRIGFLDMTDSTIDCPEGFKLYTSGSVRACGRPGSQASCVSIKMPSNGISYSSICGRVTGYQFGSPDAIHPGNNHDNVDEYYVDGVSITMGYPPRKHLWTLINGYSDTFYTASNCPCNSPTPPNQITQSFVGNDYFCESGNPNGWWGKMLYTSDPVWDGGGCGAQETACCNATGLPWFTKSFDATTEYVELRVCGDQQPIDEDSPISNYEMYVK